MMKANEVEITPAKAKELLAGNTCNRKVNLNFVAALASDMANGRWQANGDAIRVNGTRLLDGQHRLMACIEANKPFRTLLVSGLDSDCFKTIDTGRSRSGSDLMSLLGEKNTNVLVATCNWVHRYASDTRIHSYATRLTNQQMLDLLKEHPGIRDSVDWLKSSKTVSHMRASYHAALHYLFGLANSERRDEFYTSLRDGDGLIKDSPVYVLRNKLIDNASSRAKIHDTYLIALVIKAFNLSLEGKKCQIIRWIETEPYPSINGLPPEKVSSGLFKLGTSK